LLRNDIKNGSRKTVEDLMDKLIPISIRKNYTTDKKSGVKPCLKNTYLEDLMVECFAERFNDAEAIWHATLRDYYTEYYRKTVEY
jgi:hypothetical protein